MLATVEGMLARCQEIRPPAIRFVAGDPVDTVLNAARLFRDGHGLIGLGYALDGYGLWQMRAWIVGDGVWIEAPPRRLAYFGGVLDAEESATCADGALLRERA